MLGRRGGQEAGRRRRKSESPALKSGPAEGKKQGPGRVPAALRAWATAGHCPGPSGGSLPRVSLKGGSREAAQPLSGWSPPTASLCLGTDTWGAAAGALRAQPGAVPAGPHTCPPSAPRKLDRVLAQQSRQQDRRELWAPTVGIRICGEGRSNWAELGWAGLEEHIPQWVGE